MDAFIHNNMVAACIKVQPTAQADRPILHPVLLYCAEYSIGAAYGNRWLIGRSVRPANSPLWCVPGQQSAFLHLPLTRLSDIHGA